jgi:hypothetical protein
VASFANSTPSSSARSTVAPWYPAGLLRLCRIRRCPESGLLESSGTRSVLRRHQSHISVRRPSISMWPTEMLGDVSQIFGRRRHHQPPPPPHARGGGTREQPRQRGLSRTRSRARRAQGPLHDRCRPDRCANSVIGVDHVPIWFSERRSLLTLIEGVSTCRKKRDSAS